MLAQHFDEQQHIGAYLDGLPRSLRHGDPRQVKVNVMQELLF